MCKHGLKHHAHRQRRLQGYFDAVKQQNALIKEKKEELAEFGKTDPAVLAADPDLQLLEEVRDRAI